MLPQKSSSENTKKNNTINTFNRQFEHTWKFFGFSTILNMANIRKVKGEPTHDIFRFLFLLIFNNMTLSEYLSSGGKTNCKKDTYYRFLNNEHYNWARFLNILAIRVITKIEEFLRPNTTCCLVLDDSFFQRLRSKSVELLANCYDHVDHQFKRGFFLLTLGWTDGTSFIPVSFNLLSSPKKKNRYCEANDKIDHRTNGWKRRMDAKLSKTDAAFKLIKNAVDSGIRAQYVLMDTWFTTEPFIKRLTDCGIDVIGMVKQLRQSYYYHGKYYSLHQLAARAHFGSTSDILGSLTVMTAKEKIPVKIVFVRNRNKKGECLYLLSTDTHLSDEKIVRNYSLRWDIECFFKAEKGIFGMTRQIQSQNYDAMVCHTTVAFTRYIVLEWIRRTSTDERSFGELFRYFSKDVVEAPIKEVLLNLMELCFDMFEEGEKISPEAVRKQKMQMKEWLDKQTDAIRDLFSYIDGYHVILEDLDAIEKIEEMEKLDA